MWVDARVAIKKLSKSLISSRTILSSITLKTFSAAPMDSFFFPRSFQITIELYSNNVALLVFAAATASVQLTCFSKMHPDAFAGEANIYFLSLIELVLSVNHK